MSATLALAVALLRGTPDAGGDRVGLQWSAPEGCPDSVEVADDVRALLLDRDASPTASGEIRRAADRFELVLVLGDGATAIPYRHTAADCVALARVAALLVAVSADPVAVTQTPPVRAAIPPAADASSPNPTEDDPTTSAPSRPDPPGIVDAAVRRRAVGWLRVHGIVGVAELPRIDTGVGVAAAIGVERWRVELHAHHLFAQTEPVPGLDPARARLTAWNAGLRGCLELARRRRWAAGGCAGVEAGALVAEGRRVATPGSDVSLWAAAIAGPAVRVFLGRRLELHTGLDAVIGVRRPTFALRDDTRSTVAAGAGGLRAWLGVAIGFGGAANRRGP